MKKFFLITILLLCGVGILNAQHQKIHLWGHHIGKSVWPTKMYIYPAPDSINTGVAVIVCPGGSYSHLMGIKTEGFGVAEWLNSQGINAFVLYYRTGNKFYHHPAMIQDVQRAIQYVRDHAKEFRDNPDKLGTMGFSAGGHLASVTATLTTGADAPNFQILMYPVITMMPDHMHRGSHDNFLGTEHSKRQLKRLEQQYSSDQQVTRVTPRAFVALSDDDDLVMPTNGVSFYTECLRHDVPASLYVYPTGGHGWGYRESFDHHYEMVFNLKAWLQSF